MIVNTFSVAWFLIIALQIIIILFLYFICKGKTEKYKINVMTVFYIFLWVFYILYKGYLIYIDDLETSIWNELPFALCQAASLAALPGLLKKDRTLLGFCFFVGSTCSLVAMIMPVTGFYDLPIYSGRIIGYYGFHGLVFVQSVAIYLIGLYKPKVKDTPKVMLLLALLALVAHGINFLIRSTVYPEANYFFTYDPSGNPVLQLFRSLIPINYVYLLPLIPPIGLIFTLMALVFGEKKKK